MGTVVRAVESDTAQRKLMKTKEVMEDFQKNEMSKLAHLLCDTFSISLAQIAPT